MKLEFRVLRDKALIFKSAAMADESHTPEITQIALKRFHKQFPHLSLAAEDTVLKWVEVRLSQLKLGPTAL